MSIFANSETELLKHLVKRHRNTSRFIIHYSATGCGVSYKNCASFKSHCRRKHFKDKLNVTNSITYVYDEDDNNDTHEAVGPSQDRNASEAAYILKLKAGQRSSQIAVDVI